MANKLIKLDEKYNEIERENHLLLRKLKNILKKKHQESSEELNYKDSNFSKRKRFLEELTKTNRKFLVTLNSTKSCYNFK